MTYIAQTYDFHVAISKMHQNLDIYSTERITDNQYLINSNRGKFVCESFEDDNACVYMKVYEVI